jgi:hypothetical protein
MGRGCRKALYRCIKVSGGGEGGGTILSTLTRRVIGLKDTRDAVPSLSVTPNVNPVGVK